jgi:Flp pilus assembly protein TadD
LCSGSARLDFRPQWNYDLMNAGYLLSLFISAVLFIGVVKVALRFLRRPTAEWFLLAGLISAFAAGIVFMTLRVPSYAQVKALYSLPALLPLCAIVALGWDFLVARLPWARSLLWGGMATWALTAYASFWIQSEDAYTPTAQGISLAADQRYNEAATKFSRALQLDPAALGAGVGLTDALNRTGQYADARKQAALTLQQHPEAPEALIQAAITMTIDNHYEEAVGYLRQAISHAPDHPAAYEQLAFCLNALHRPREVVAVCVEGLRVNPFSAELHNSLAAAAREIGDATNAATHLGYASELNR